MIIPKDYEDCIGVPRSVISYNSSFLKVNNVVSFNPNSVFEVNYIFIYQKLNYIFIDLNRHIASLLEALFIYSLYIMKIKRLLKQMKAILKI